jgi:hypothetical protein
MASKGQWGRGVVDALRQVHWRGALWLLKPEDAMTVHTMMTMIDKEYHYIGSVRIRGDWMAVYLSHDDYFKFRMSPAWPKVIADGLAYVERNA